MARTIAIGDVHGCNETLKLMLFQRLRIEKSDEVYFVGDYIDRGIGSKEVIDTIMSLQEQGYHIHTLRGNHEQMMIESELDEELANLWYLNGGDTTLTSFGVPDFQSMPETYRQFFLNTKIYISTPDYIFVHAGLNFSRQDILEDQEAMLWERDFKPNQPALKNKLLIHGHTPKPLDYILHQQGNCINIDGGCVYTGRHFYGNLVAISLPSREFFIEPNID